MQSIQRFKNRRTNIAVFKNPAEIQHAINFLQNWHDVFLISEISSIYRETFSMKPKFAEFHN